MVHGVLHNIVLSLSRIAKQNGPEKCEIKFSNLLVEHLCVIIMLRTDNCLKLQELSLLQQIYLVFEPIS